MGMLQSIQDQLNRDAVEQSKFQADPVSYLSEKGLSLSSEAKKQLEARLKTTLPDSPDWGNLCMFG